MQGSCLCGEITYELEGGVRGMSHCHCSICRKIHGTLYATYVTVGNVRILTGQDCVSEYRSSENFERRFCKCCGSVLPENVEGADFSFVAAGGICDSINVKAEKHIFASSRASWHRITDDLPQYDGYGPDVPAGGVDQPSRAGKHEGAVAGSCLCGKATYRFTGTPEFMWHCHCSRCRKVKGAAHASNIFIKPENFEWLSGQEAVVDYRLPETVRFGNSFCTDCGSSMPRLSGGVMMVIPAGSLDDDPGIEPLGHIYVGSKAQWDNITDDYPQFVEMPPSQ